MERLQAYFDKLLRETSYSFHRYLYHEINWDARMIGIVGPRGVGKTTLVLQHVKEQLFVVKDDIETGYGNIIPLWMFGLTY